MPGIFRRPWRHPGRRIAPILRPSLASPPGVPTSVVAAPISPTRIDLTWAAPAGGAPVTGYRVRIDGGSPVDVGADFAYSFLGLLPDTAYMVEVQSYGPSGASSWVTLTASTDAVPVVLHPLRLEVEDDPPPGMLRNLLMNPNGELGGAGWVTPENGVVSAGAGELVYTPGAPLGTYFETDSVPVTPGEYLNARINVTRLTSSGQWVAQIQFGGIPTAYGQGWPENILTGIYFPDFPSDPETTPGEHVSDPIVVPAGMVKARMRILYLTPDVAIGVNHAAIVTQASSSPVTWADVVDQVDWIDVLGPTHEIEVDRSQVLDLGTLTATILDAELDPAVADTLSTGRACRLTALDATTGLWEPLFTGRIDTAKVTYDTKRAAANPTDPKVARIALTAIDPTAPLARQPRPNGVGTVDELREVLEGCGVPWIINGSSDQIAGAVTVSRNESASALDQVGVTRDSRSAYAWVDRTGTFQAWDAAEIPEDPDDAVLLDETTYSDLALSYDPDALINLVVVTYLTYDPLTSETLETKYGPFIDPASYSKHGERRAEFTVHGLVASDVDPASAVADFAAAVLAANATAVRTCDSVTVPIRTQAEVTPGRVLIDQCQLVQVVNVGKSFDQLLRVTGVVHRISAEPKRRKWDVTYTFAPVGTVAAPQYTPPVPTSAPNGWTLPALTNGWVEFSTDTPPRFRKVGDRVEIEGTVKDGTPGTQIFQLPAGYRPVGNINRATVADGAFGWFAVQGADGALIHKDGSGWVSIACMYRAEQ